MINELKGYHVLAIAVAAFAVIITANMAMLFAATGTFPGLVVKNAYVASQGWNARTSAQQALGWEASISYGGGAVRVALVDDKGAQVETDLIVTIGRPTTDAEDVTRTLATGAGSGLVPVELGPGTWRVEIRTPDGAYRRSTRLYIPVPD